MMDNNDILRIEDVMEYLNIGKNTIYGLLQSGELKAFKIGKLWKIPRKAVEEYVERAMNQDRH